MFFLDFNESKQNLFSGESFSSSRGRLSKNCSSSVFLDISSFVPEKIMFEF